MTASRKRTNVQDVTISEMTTDLAERKVFITLHFVTVEFDYYMGMDFVNQLRAKLDLIAPILPHKSTPELHESGK